MLKQTHYSLGNQHGKLPEMRHMQLVEVNLCHLQVCQQFPPACYPPTLSATESDNNTNDIIGRGGKFHAQTDCVNINGEFNLGARYIPRKRA